MALVSKPPTQDSSESPNKREGLTESRGPQDLEGLQGPRDDINQEGQRVRKVKQESGGNRL